MRQKGTLGWLKHDVTHRGITAWSIFILMALFYLLLYLPDKLGTLGGYFGNQAGWAAVGDKLNIFTHLMNALGQRLRPALGLADGSIEWVLFGGWTLKPKTLGDAIFSKWTLYGTLYTTAITVGGWLVIRKYRHNRYQVIRTLAVMTTQITLAFSVPLLLSASGTYGYYMSYFWPLKIESIYPNNLQGMPIFFALYSLLGAFLLVPILGVFFGKRWYCSWICGCGGLANTFGDPWRQLSNKSNKAWRFEKISIHTGLIIAVFTTALVGAKAIIGQRYPEFGAFATFVEFMYGLVFTAFLSAAVGTALYPLGGTRVWCRFFCPMAAVLGLVQKFGRYRITVKKNMCISCGLCSKYCEMGIDVRAYAQRNQTFVRASCVGCGLCAEVCPRGVLSLENRDDEDPQELTMEHLLSNHYVNEPERKAV